MSYESPAFQEIGTLQDLTLQGTNKIGPDPDAFSNIVPVVGSLTPLP